MNVERLKPRERKVLALGLLGVLVLVLVFVVLMPYASRYGHYLNAMEDQQFRLERLRASAEHLPALEAEIERMRSRFVDARYVFDQETPSLAAARIQEDVSRAVATHGGEVRSMRVGRPLSEEGFTRIIVGVRMTAGTSELAALLADIDARRPLMFIDNVQINVPRQQLRARGGRQESGSVEIDFDIQAYMLESDR